MQHRILLGLVLVGLFYSAQSVQVRFKDCGSVEGVISKVDVAPCPSEPCPLVHNTNTSISVTFTTKEAVTAATSVVHGIIAGIPVPFPIPNNDGCKDSGLECPLKPNTEYVFQTKLYISGAYPKVSVVVKWELQDQVKKDLFVWRSQSRLLINHQLFD